MNTRVKVSTDLLFTYTFITLTYKYKLNITFKNLSIGLLLFTELKQNNKIIFVKNWNSCLVHFSFFY